MYTMTSKTQGNCIFVFLSLVFLFTVVLGIISFARVIFGYLTFHIFAYIFSSVFSFVLYSLLAR